MMHFGLRMFQLLEVVLSIQGILCSLVVAWTLQKRIYFEVQKGSLPVLVRLWAGQMWWWGHDRKFAEPDMCLPSVTLQRSINQGLRRKHSEGQSVSVCVCVRTRNTSLTCSILHFSLCKYAMMGSVCVFQWPLLSSHNKRLFMQSANTCLLSHGDETDSCRHVTIKTICVSQVWVSGQTWLKCQRPGWGRGQGWNKLLPFSSRLFVRFVWPSWQDVQETAVKVASEWCESFALHLHHRPHLRGGPKFICIISKNKDKIKYFLSPGRRLRWLFVRLFISGTTPRISWHFQGTSVGTDWSWSRTCVQPTGGLAPDVCEHHCRHRCFFLPGSSVLIITEVWIWC